MGKIARRHFWANSMCYSPLFWEWARGTSMIWAKNLLGCARVIGYHTSVFRWNIYGNLDGQMSKMAWTRHYRANLMCYSPRFQGWAQDQSILWAENLYGPAREVVNHPSVVLFNIRGNLGGKIVETSRTGYFWAKLVCYIAYNSRGGLGFRACCGMKVDRGMPERLGFISVWSISITVTI